MAQDSQIQSRFLAGWSTTLNTNMMFATRARRGVENSRLMLDAAKAKSKGQGWNLPGQKKAEHQDEEVASEEARIEIEQAEDEFVGQTEEAVGVMKNVRVLNPLAIYANSPGPRYPGAPPQSRRLDRRSARIPQEGIRDSERACTRC